MELDYGPLTSIQTTMGAPPLTSPQGDEIFDTASGWMGEREVIVNESWDRRRGRHAREKMLQRRNSRRLGWVGSLFESKIKKARSLLGRSPLVVNAKV